MLEKAKLIGSDSAASGEAPVREVSRERPSSSSSSAAATSLKTAPDLPALGRATAPEPAPARPSAASGTTSSPGRGNLGGAPLASVGLGGSGAPGLLPPNFAIPGGTRLPPGILVGDDVAVMAAVRDALGPLGATLEILAGAEVVRRLDSVPALQVIVVGQAGTPPCAAVAPFVDLPARLRRHTFIILVASDVKTLDGNQAFLHEVDLVLNKGDLDRAAELVVAAYDYRNRLYGPLLEAEETAYTS